jgi:hypothetical protein
MASDVHICAVCDLPFVKKISDIEFDSGKTGDFIVEKVLHYKCEKCGAVLIKPPESKRVEVEGAVAQLVYYLNKHGLQPLEYFKHRIEVEDDVLKEAVDILVASGKVLAPKVGKMQMLCIVRKHEEKKGWFERLKAKFKGKD